MKRIRFFALLSLALAACISSHAKTNWENFEDAEKKYSWAKAAALIPLIESPDISPEALARFAYVFERTGEVAKALQYSERSFWHPVYGSRYQAAFNAGSYRDFYLLRCSQIMRTVTLAQRTKQTPRDPYIAAYAKYDAGDITGALADFRALQSSNDSSEKITFAVRTKNELYAEYSQKAYDKKDWATAAALGRAIRYETPNDNQPRFCQPTTNQT